MSLVVERAPDAAALSSEGLTLDGAQVLVSAEAGAAADPAACVVALP